MPDLTLYYWPTPNGWKISIALAELALPYDLVLVDINAGDQFKPDFLAISPNNKMPALVDREGPGGAPISLFESGAILRYLAQRTGKLGGATAREALAVDQWLMWQMGGLGPMAGQAHHFIHYAPQMGHDLPYAKDRYRTEVARLYGVLDRQLARHSHVAGDFLSIADIAIWPWASLWERQEQDLSDKPHLAEWLARLGARPAFQTGRALALDKRAATGASAESQKNLFGKK